MFLTIFIIMFICSPYVKSGSVLLLTPKHQTISVGDDLSFSWRLKTFGKENYIEQTFRLGNGDDKKNILLKSYDKDIEMKNQYHEIKYRVLDNRWNLKMKNFTRPTNLTFQLEVLYFVKEKSTYVLGNMVINQFTVQVKVAETVTTTKRISTTSQTTTHQGTSTTVRNTNTTRTSNTTLQPIKHLMEPGFFGTTSTPGFVNNNTIETTSNQKSDEELTSSPVFLAICSASVGCLLTLAIVLLTYMFCKKKGIRKSEIKVEAKVNSQNDYWRPSIDFSKSIIDAKGDEEYTIPFQIEMQSLLSKAREDIKKETNSTHCHYMVPRKSSNIIVEYEEIPIKRDVLANVLANDEDYANMAAYTRTYANL